MLVDTQYADCYQELFNHLMEEHDLTLTISEMDEIISKCLETIKRKKELTLNG